ncbi:MAG: hypothetical protein JWM80_3066 [Cyanobacteria bacterium RYN_339]|nr:hypothetical protein [Cyanobacteria bacterium RYN_339]
MSVASIAARQLRRLTGGEVGSAERKVGRELFTKGGNEAEALLGVDIGGAKAALPRKRGKGHTMPTDQLMLANKARGYRREGIIEKLLKALFPKEENFRVYGEQYLRDRFGNIAIHDATHESRRIDFLVLKGKEIVQSVEVTGEEVSKAAQLQKEMDIRKHGGRYVLDPESGELLRWPAGLKTRVVRLK